MLSPHDQTNPLYTVVVLHFTHHIKARGGGTLSNAQKNIIKTYQEQILYKPVGKNEFTMACIRALAMIAYQVIYFLISQPKHILWVLKRSVTMRRFF